MHMDNAIQRRLDAGTRAVHKSLQDLAIHDLRVDIVGDSVYLRGLVSGYEKKCLAGARALTAFPGTYVSNQLRVSRV
jgi:hypothetical protein